MPIRIGLANGHIQMGNRFNRDTNPNPAKNIVITLPGSGTAANVFTDSLQK
jgi:hypothetical protein